MVVLTDSQKMTLREAQVLVLKVLKQVMEEKLDQHNVQLAQVRTVHYHVTCASLPYRQNYAGHDRQRFPHPG